MRFLEEYFETSQPILFPSHHDFNTLLDFLISKPPKDWQDMEYGDHNLQIKLPYFDNKNVLSQWYLSRRNQAAFTKRVAQFFKVVFRGSINQSIILGFSKQDSIDIFMTQYNLPADTWDMLAKDYSRYLTLRRTHKIRKSSKNLVSLLVLLSQGLIADKICDALTRSDTLFDALPFLDSATDLFNSLFF